MSYEYSEDNLIENATQDVLEDLGWQVQHAWTKESFGVDGLLGRENKSEVILRRYLLGALKELNPGLPAAAYDQAIEQIQVKNADQTLPRNNHDKYILLKTGVPVSFHNKDGELEKKTLRVINYEDYTQNHFLAVRQLEIVGELYSSEDDDFHVSTERRLLYTCMTRARERLYLLSSGKPSRYLAEIDEKWIDKVGNSPILQETSKPEPHDDLPF